MADQIEGLPEGAVVGPSLAQKDDNSQIEGLPEGATVGPSLSPAATHQGTTKTEAPGIVDKAWGTVASVLPEGSEDVLSAAKKLVVDPFEKMAHKGAEVGADIGAGYLQGASGGASGMSPVPRQEPLTEQQTHEQHPIATGIAEGVGGTVGGMVADPRNWPLMGEGAVRPVLKKVMAGGFSTMMGSNTVNAAKDLYQNWGTMTPEQRSEALTTTGLSAFFAEEAARHAGLTKPITDPAIRTAGKTVRALHDNAPAIGAGIGAVTGFVEGGPIGGYFGMKGGHYGGSLLQKYTPNGEGLATYDMSPAQKNVDFMTREFKKAKADADAARAEHAKFSAGQEQGVPAPEPVLKARDKAEAHEQLIKEHLEAAHRAVAEEKAAAPAVPDQPLALSAEQQDAQAARVPKEPVAQPKVAPGNTTTVNPQEPIEAPQAFTGMRKLGPTGEAGTVGKPLMLPEHATETAPAPAEAPQAPDVRPLAPPAPATAAEMAGLKAVGGKVVEAPEKAVGPLIKQGLTEGSKAAKTEAVAETPKSAEPKAEAPKEAPERSPEDLTKVDTVIKELPNQDLIRHGGRFGVDESKYDFSKREALREGGSKHPIEREAHANATVKALPEALKNHIVDAANDWDAKDPSVFDQASRSNASRAERARAIMNEAKTRWENELAAKGQSGASGKVDNEEGVGGLERWQGKNPLDKASVRPTSERVNLPADTDKTQPFPAEDKTWEEQLLAARKTVNKAKAYKDMTPAEKETLAAKGQSGGAPDEKDTEAHSGFQRQPRGTENIKPPYEEKWSDITTEHPPIAKPEDVLTSKEAADKENEHLTRAQKEMPDAALSEQLQKAQEYKTAKAHVDAHNENGGATIHPKDGNLDGKPRFSVGGEPEFDKPELRLNVDGKDLTPAQMEEFNARPEVKAALKAHPDASVGSWYDKEADKSVVELVKTPADKAEATKMGEKNNQKAIYDLAKHEDIPTGGTGESAAPAKQYKDMTPEEKEALAAKGQSGGAPSKKLPTGDDLIKKYGESDGDPAHTAFILQDGRGVAQTGTIHDEMLGGKATDANPPREQFVEGGGIRVRAHGVYGNRETALSIPPRMTPEQLAYIKKMSPQLRSGAVMIEGARPGDDYRVIEHGKATDEALEKNIREISRVLPKGYPEGTPEVGGGAPSAATKMAKEKPEVDLGETAEKHLTPEEREGVTKSPAQTEKFLSQMEKIPEVHEYADIANAGAGARKWYQRSTKAFDAMAEEAPEYFKEEGDKEKFTNLLAASSPRQSVAMNLRETLRTWKAYVDAGRPTGEELKTLLGKNLTPAVSKVPNALKAINGEEMWPDITKNKNFKVPSFSKNLNGWLGSVTNDGWMSLFAGLDPREISSAHSYHPLSVATRAAAEELGWGPAEAQAAIWSFTQALTERGEELPEEVRKHSEDFVDLLAHDPYTRELLADLGVSHANLDAKLAAIGEKPEVSSRTSPTTSRSVGRLKDRIEAARGQGTIPPPKSAQGELGFREAPAGEGKSKLKDEDVTFDPEKFRTQTGEDTELKPLGKKRSPLGKATR